MYAAVIKFFLSWWKEILIALVIIGAIWYVKNLQDTVKDQQVTIGSLTIANQVLTDSNKVLTKTVTANNETIAELGKGAENTKREFQKLNADVEHKSRVLNGRLKAIMANKAPVTCEATINYMLEAAPSYKR